VDEARSKSGLHHGTTRKPKDSSGKKRRRVVGASPGRAPPWQINGGLAALNDRDSGGCSNGPANPFQTLHGQRRGAFRGAVRGFLGRWPLGFFARRHRHCMNSNHTDIRHAWMSVTKRNSRRLKRAGEFVACCT
jgi:hypothetical protein